MFRGGPRRGVRLCHNPRQPVGDHVVRARRTRNRIMERPPRVPGRADPDYVFVSAGRAGILHHKGTKDTKTRNPGSARSASLRVFSDLADGSDRYLLGGGAASVMPWRRKTSDIFPWSGGPPAALMTSEASRKYAGPMIAGLMMTSSSRLCGRDCRSGAPRRGGCTAPARAPPRRACRPPSRSGRPRRRRGSPRRRRSGGPAPAASARRGRGSRTPTRCRWNRRP